MSTLGGVGGAGETAKPISQARQDFQNKLPKNATKVKAVGTAWIRNESKQITKQQITFEAEYINDKGKKQTKKFTVVRDLPVAWLGGQDSSQSVSVNKRLLNALAKRSLKKITKDVQKNLPGRAESGSKSSSGLVKLQKRVSKLFGKSAKPVDEKPIDVTEKDKGSWGNWVNARDENGVSNGAKALDRLLDDIANDSDDFGQEGIYRLSARADLLTEAKSSLQSENMPSDLLVNDKADLIKTVLRETEDLSCTQEFWQAAIDSLDAKGNVDDVARALAKSLPNKPILKKLFSHLGEVVSKSSTNKMDTANITRMFVPNLVENKSADLNEAMVHATLGTNASSIALMDQLIHHPELFDS